MEHGGSITSLLIVIIAAFFNTNPITSISTKDDTCRRCRDHRWDYYW